MSNKKLLHVSAPSSFLRLTYEFYLTVCMCDGYTDCKNILGINNTKNIEKQAGRKKATEKAFMEPYAPDKRKLLVKTYGGQL